VVHGNEAGSLVCSAQGDQGDRMGIVLRLRGRLEGGHALLWIVVLSVVLVLPALVTGFVLDDHGQQLMLRGAPGLERPPHDLYSFLLDDPEWRRLMREQGGLPWYTDPEISARLWRPLSSLTLYLDYLIAPGSAVVAHVHSLLWCGALVWVVGLLYRRQLAPPWVAALATLLYAVDDAHGMAAAFIANRNAWVAMVFATLALLFHIRWRQDGHRLAGWLAPLSLALGLLGGEMALSITAYLFAYALVLEEGSIRRRLATLLPGLLVSLLWLVSYRALGYGTANSGLYIDPINNPWRYAVACLERVPLLLQGQLTPIPAELAVVVSETTAWLLVAGATAGIAVTLAVLWPWLAGNRQARFWALGMVISVLPVCATFPHDRLLLPVSLGAFALVAMVVSRAYDQALQQDRAYWKRRGLRYLAGFWVVSHLFIAPVLLPLKTYSGRLYGRIFEDNARSMDNLPDLAGRTLVVVRGPDIFTTSWAVLIRQNLGLSIPDRLRVLGTTLGQVEVSRSDSRTLRLAAPMGFVTFPLDRIMRSYDRPFRVGETHGLGDLTIRVTAITGEGRPAELSCRFQKPLEDSSLVWAERSADGYQPFALPEVGETVVLPAFTVWDLLLFRYPP
jgi:hypothetical protein